MGFFSKKRKTKPEADPGTPSVRVGEPEPSAGSFASPEQQNWLNVLADCVKGHFPEGSSDGAVVDTGLHLPGESSTVRIATQMDLPMPFGQAQFMTSVYFQIFGGPFGDDPIFASASGYGASPTEATIGGGCNWTCVFRPLARAACGLDLGPDSETVTDMPLTRADGRSYRLLFDGWSRATILRDDPTDPEIATKIVSARLTDGTMLLSPIVVESDLLPPLAEDRVTLLSTFIMELPGERVVEIKVDGVDQEQASSTLFRREGPSIAGSHGVLLRELAVLIPADQPGDSARSARGH